MSKGSEELRVLFARYGRVHVLVNAAQCSSSIFIARTISLKSKRRYLRELLLLEERRVLLFDLDRFWIECLRPGAGDAAGLAIVVDLKTFSEPTRDLFSRSVYPALRRLGLDEKCVAFRIPSDTIVTTIDAGELVLHGRIVADRLEARGLLALRPKAEGLGFLFDLDLLLGSRLLFSTIPESEVKA